MRANLVGALAAAVVIGVALTVTVTRGPGFHDYADTRSFLGIPHAGDVLSNLAFLIVCARGLRHAYVSLGRLVCLGVGAIGLGSGLYHLAPSDTLLAFDWAPIAITLGLLSAAVIGDRGGRGGTAALVAVAFAIGSVVWWIAGGGTHGGNMAPYVAFQLACIVVPPVVAVVARGEARAGWLFAGLGGFALARLFGAYDRALLDAIGISGHSLKHLAAAQAAACALRALLRR